MPETGSIRTNKDSGKENSSTIYLFHIKNEIMFQILRSPYPIGFGYDETSHIINSHKIPSSTLSEVIIYLLTFTYTILPPLSPLIGKCKKSYNYLTPTRLIFEHF